MTGFRDLRVEPFRFRWACPSLRLASPPISGTEPGSSRCGQGQARHDASPGVNTLSRAQTEATKSSSRAKVHLSLAPLQGQSARAGSKVCGVTSSLGQLCALQQPCSKQGGCPGSNPTTAFHLLSCCWDAPENSPRLYPTTRNNYWGNVYGGTTREALERTVALLVPCSTTSRTTLSDQ